MTLMITQDPNDDMKHCHEMASCPSSLTMFSQCTGQDSHLKPLGCELAFANLHHPLHNSERVPSAES